MPDAPPLAVTMGDPAGIGGELTVMAWMAREEAGVPPFYAIDDPARLSGIMADLSMPGTAIEIDDPAEAIAAFAHGVPVMPLPLPAPHPPSQPNPANATAVIAAISFSPIHR